MLTLALDSEFLSCGAAAIIYVKSLTCNQKKKKTHNRSELQDGRKNQSSDFSFISEFPRVRSP